LQPSEWGDIEFDWAESVVKGEAKKTNNWEELRQLRRRVAEPNQEQVGPEHKWGGGETQTNL